MKWTEEMAQRRVAIQPSDEYARDGDGNMVRVYHHHPLQDLEPEERIEDPVRQARVKCVALLNQSFAVIDAALSGPTATVQDGRVAVWGIALSMGLNMCAGTSVTETAARLGVRKATLSKKMTAFAAANDLPHSAYMKDEASRAAYANARLESIQRKTDKADD
jgi:hypothetical protein